MNDCVVCDGLGCEHCRAVDCRLPLWNKSGEVVGHSLIDPDDHRRFSGMRFYRTSHGYARTTLGESREYLHRLVLGHECAGLEVDHINGDTLDNRRSNLRAVTHAENAANRIGRHARNRSGYRGVYKNERGSWTAQTAIGGKTRYLGRYETPEEAERAVREELGRTLG